MDPTLAYEIAPLLPEAGELLPEAGERSLPRRSRFAVPFGVFALVGIGAVFAYVVGSPIQVHRAGLEGVVEFAAKIRVYAAEIRVYVMTLENDEFTLVCEPQDTIDNVKSKLSDKIGVQPKAFALYLNGAAEELQGESRLDDAGITNSSRVFMGMLMNCPPRPSAGGGSPLMATMARRRLKKEEDEVLKSCGDVVSFSEDISVGATTWHLNLKGPAGSPYDGGNFPLTVSFPTKYPFQPPSLAFDTPIYHLNVASDGRVCFPSITQDDYSSHKAICSILLELLSYLQDPVPDIAFRQELALLFKENKAEYLEKAKASVES